MNHDSIACLPGYHYQLFAIIKLLTAMMSWMYCNMRIDDGMREQISPPDHSHTPLCQWWKRLNVSKAHFLHNHLSKSSSDKPLGILLTLVSHWLVLPYCGCVDGCSDILRSASANGLSAPAMSTRAS